MNIYVTISRMSSCATEWLLGQQLFKTTSTVSKSYKISRYVHIYLKYIRVHTRS